MNILDWITRHVSDLRKVVPWESAVSVKLPDRAAGGYVINIDSARVVGQFIVWTTGAMEATAGAVADGQIFYTDAASSEDTATLDQRWARFCAEILRIENPDLLT